MTAWRKSSLLVIALLAMAGCGGGQLPPPAQPPAEPRYGAPLVSNPRDVTAIFEQPCEQLTPAERMDLDIEVPGTPRSYLGDAECRWRTQNGASLLLSVDRDRDLLTDTYRARLLPIFLPSIVQGYPAVRQQTSAQDNNCIVTIGLGPRQALEADWTGLGTVKPGDPDPCERAETAAAMVIRKLPPQR